MNKQPAAAAALITLSVNCVANGKFFAAGEAIPYTNEGDVPPALAPFILREEEDDAGTPETPTLAFRPNTVYTTTPEGHILSPAGKRQAAQLAHEAAWQAAAEVAAEEAQVLPDGVAEALAAEHDVRIGIALATAELAARDRDGAPAAIQAAPDEEEGAGAEQKPADPLYVGRIIGTHSCYVCNAPVIKCGELPQDNYLF